MKFPVLLPFSQQPTVTEHKTLSCTEELNIRAEELDAKSLEIEKYQHLEILLQEARITINRQSQEISVLKHALSHRSDDEGLLNVELTAYKTEISTLKRTVQKLQEENNLLRKLKLNSFEDSILTEVADAMRSSAGDRSLSNVSSNQLSQSVKNPLPKPLPRPELYFDDENLDFDSMLNECDNPALSSSNSPSQKLQAKEPANNELPPNEVLSLDLETRESPRWPNVQQIDDANNFAMPEWITNDSIRSPSPTKSMLIEERNQLEEELLQQYTRMRKLESMEKVLLKLTLDKI